MASPGAPSGYRTRDLEFLACDPLVSRGSGANTAFSSLVLELFASLLHVNSVHLSSASASWGPAACQARGDRNLRVLLREQGLPVNPAGGPRVRGGGGGLPWGLRQRQKRAEEGPPHAGPRWKHPRVLLTVTERMLKIIIH